MPTILTKVLPSYHPHIGPTDQRYDLASTHRTYHLLDVLAFVDIFYTFFNDWTSFINFCQNGHLWNVLTQTEQKHRSILALFSKLATLTMPQTKPCYTHGGTPLFSP
jgi:hypothetical protein